MASILLVDDDVALLARLGAQLEQEGYDVLKMSEAAPARVIFEEHLPHLVVLEVRTNRHAGWDLLPHFAARSSVIILSADGREEDVVRGLREGAVDYMAKPYRSAELLTRIRLRLLHTNHYQHTTTPLWSRTDTAVLEEHHEDSPQPEAYTHHTEHSQEEEQNVGGRTDGSDGFDGSELSDRSDITVNLEHEHQRLWNHGVQDWNGQDEDEISYSPHPFPSSSYERDAVQGAPPSPSSPPSPHKQAEDNHTGYTHQWHHPADSSLPWGSEFKPDSERDEPTPLATEAEDIAILRSKTIPLSETTEANTLPDDVTLGRRLHVVRKERHVTLVQAENDLHINMAYLQAIEDEKFSLLPQNNVVDMLHSYAAYLGVDVGEVLQEYERFHQTPPVQPTFSPRNLIKPVNPLPLWIFWLAAFVLALAVSGAGIFLFDPEGVNALGGELRELLNGPTTTPKTMQYPTPQLPGVFSASPDVIPTISPSLPPTPTTLPEPSTFTSVSPITPITPISPTNSLSSPEMVIPPIPPF